MKNSKYNKSIFIFIIVVLLVLIAYTIVNLMHHNNDSSVVDTVTESVESIVDVSNEPYQDTGY